MVCEKMLVSKTAGGETNERVYLDETELSETELEKYLGMSLRAEGPRTEVSKGRIHNAEQEGRTLTACPWWSLALKPSQSGPISNAMVRAKYRYGLNII